MNYPNEITAILDQLGTKASVVDADKTVDWIWHNFPFSLPGTTVEWTKVPSAKTIPVSFSDVTSLKSAFEQLSLWVGAKEDQQVIVLWHNVHLPALSMSVSACRSVFGGLVEVVGEEMHIASPEGDWYMEFDKFFDECHGARLTRH